MYRFRPKKYTSVLTIIILITIIYYLQVVLSTFREFPGHIVELPVQVSYSGTTVQRISGLKKNVTVRWARYICHSQKIGCCSEPKNPVKQDWLLPFGNSRVKFLLLQIPCYFQVKSYYLHKANGQLNLPLSPAPFLSLPSSGYEIPCTLFLPPQGSSSCQNYLQPNGEFSSTEESLRSRGQGKRSCLSPFPSLYVTLADCFWLQPPVQQIHENDHGWGRKNVWGALGANWDSIFI